MLREPKALWNRVLSFDGGIREVWGCAHRRIARSENAVD